MATFNTILKGDEERNYLRTGDLGFIKNGELFVTGRAKDVLIIRGRNIAPQDIEATVEHSHERIRPGCTVAIGVTSDEAERLVVVAELRPATDATVLGMLGLGRTTTDDSETYSAVADAIVEAISRELGVATHRVLLLAKGGLPKTTSGKHVVQRHRTRLALLGNNLENILYDHTAKTASFQKAALQSTASASTTCNVENVTNVALAVLSEELGCDPSNIDVNAELTTYGLDSMAAMRAVGAVDEVFGVEVSPVAMLAHNTIAKFSGHVVSKSLECGQRKSKLPSASASATAASIQEDAALAGRNGYILGIGTANPDNVIESGHAAELLIDHIGLDDKASSRVRRVAENSTIERRCSVLPDGGWFFGKNCEGDDAPMSERNAIYKREAPLLAHAAAEKALADWGGDRQDITHVFAVSCTGIMTPGLEFSLVQSLGLRPNTQRLSILMMGCFGGCSGIKAASMAAAQDPRNRVLVVCCELCTLHCQMDSRTDNLVGALLFGDGAAAIVVGQNPKVGIERPLFEILKSASYIIPETTELMAWDMTPTGWRLVLSPKIPAVFMRHVGAFVDSLLGQASESRPDVLPRGALPAYDDMVWPLHPGGIAIIQAIEEACGLSKHEHTAASREVLRRVGNMSSGTIYFVLDELRRNRTSKDFAIGMSFGPGLNCEGNFMRCCPAVKSE